MRAGWIRRKPARTSRRTDEGFDAESDGLRYGDVAKKRSEGH